MTIIDTPTPKRRKRTTVSEDVPLTPKRSRLARRLAPEPTPLVADDPRAELRRLVRLHRNWTSATVIWRQTVRDRKRQDGEIIACTLPEAYRADVENLADRFDVEIGKLEKEMLVQLRSQPIYQHFLSKVPGCGVIASSYLVAMVDIHKATKPSQLIRYCGNANGPNGRRECRRRAKPDDQDGQQESVASGAPKAIGGGGTYNDTLRTMLWTMMYLGMRMACAKQRATHRYLKRWDEAKASALSLPPPPWCKPDKHASFADSKGRRKALDLFLEDLYIVWRTLEGLPVYPDWYSVKRGVGHHGRVIVPEGVVMTLEEALDVVGLSRHND